MAQHEQRATPEMTAGKWQEDLEFLRHTVHADYPFLFKKTTPEAFDAAVAGLHRDIPNMAPHEILVGLARIVASFGYGHTSLGYWEGKVPYHQLPLVLYAYDDGLYLQGAHREYEALAGARLLAIEGVPVEEVQKRMLPVVPAENAQFVKAYGLHYLTFPEFLHAQGVIPELKTEITLHLEKGGKLMDAVVTAVPAERFPRQYGMVVPGEEWVESRDLSQTPLYLKNLDRIYYYEYLPDEKAVYVRHSQIQDDDREDIPTFYDRLFQFIRENDVEKLILDVRLNGGGNNYKNKPIVTGVIRSNIDAPGKFMVIIGRRTFSACMNLVNELSTYTHAVFVGEPTSENVNFYGDNRPVTLPNSGINAYLSFAWWQDKPQWENAEWLAPHVATGMTFEQYRTNQDPALQAALAFNDSTFIQDPMAHLTRLFMGGEMEKVHAEAARMIADPNYKFFDFEGEFDQAAADLIESRRLDEARYVNGLSLEFFSDSPRVWLRQGEILEARGEETGARAAYERVLLLDPEGSWGKAAAEALEGKIGE